MNMATNQVWPGAGVAGRRAGGYGRRHGPASARLRDRRPG